MIWIILLATVVLILLVWVIIIIGVIKAAFTIIGAFFNYKDAIKPIKKN